MLVLPDDRTAVPTPVKWYRSLATRRGRQKAGAFLVEGQRAVSQIADNSPDQILEIVSTEQAASLYQEYPTRIITDKQMDMVSSTQTPQGIIAVVRMPLNTYADRLPDDVGGNILLLEDIQDPGNVGTLIRTAAAFDFSGVILTDNCADPLSPKCVQSAAGTVLSLWLRRTPCYRDLAAELKSGGYCLVAADLDGAEDTSVLQCGGKLLLALGNEGSGLSKALLRIVDHRLRVPTVGQKAESLNVAACGAICMYLSCHR